MARKGGAPENLVHFKKGYDPRRNYKGAPPILTPIKEALEKVLNEEKDGIKAIDAVFMTLRNKAIKGDIRAIQEIFDRYYGKTKQDIDLTVKELPDLPKVIIKTNG